MFVSTALALILAAPPNSGPIQLVRGQELVYGGKRIDAEPDGIARQVYDLKTRVFVLEPNPELAVMTTVETKGASTTRFECLQPNQSRTGIDPILIMELPSQPLAVGAAWSVDDYPKPPRGWTVEAAESPPQGGGQCWKLRGNQQTENWHVPDGRPAWRNEIVAWLDTKTLIAQRVERVALGRDPQQAAGIRRIITCFQIVSDMTYPDKLDAEVRAEITIARQTMDRLHDRPDERTLDGLVRRIAVHNAGQPKTEWRPAVVTAEKRMELARRGEIVPVKHETEIKPEWVVGQPAPDFVARVDQSTPFRLADVRGKPAIFCVFQSFTKPEVDRLLWDLAESHIGTAQFIAIDRTSICGQCPDFDPTILLKKQDLIQTQNYWSLFDYRKPLFADTPTPRFVLIDKDGIVRQIIDGYGPEVPTLLKQFVESSNQANTSGSSESNARK